MIKPYAFPRLIISLCAAVSAVWCASFCPLAAEDQAPETPQTVITIVNARSTDYKKNKDTGDDCIYLEGDVKISVVKGDKKTVISAEKVVYDRKTEMLYADGSVSLEQTDSTNSGGETATASSLMFNTSTLEGVFDDGRVVQTQSDALNLPSGSTLIVASDLFGRSESNTVAFKDGELTFCADPDPHWRVKASRIWLLPGGEFAFLNALLYVGVMPVMYFPAFYYPKDELVFHPVFGYRQREGYFIQTTTYLYGRKPLDTTTTTTTTSTTDSDSTTTTTDSSSTENLKALFNFMKPSKLKDQELQGLMLHNLDSDYTGSTANYFKIIGDWYSNLGSAAGFDGVYQPSGWITDIETSLLLGFSDTVFKDGSNYLPYSPTGHRYYDSSNLLGLKLPFRYKANFKLTESKPFSLTLSLPVYSDPYFTDDFGDRSETMDWISYLTETAAGTDTDDTVSEVSSFAWTANGSYAAPLSDFIKPYISTLSATLTASLNFSSMAASTLDAPDSTWGTYTPERKFYYPSQITPGNISLTLSGTLFSFASDTKSTASSASSASGNSVSFVQPLVPPDDLKTDEAEDTSDAEKNTDAGAEKKNPDAVAGETGGPDTATKTDAGDAGASAPDQGTENAGDTVDDELLPAGVLPDLTWTAPKLTQIQMFDYKLTYSITPSLTTQLAYSSTNLKIPDDFDWKKLKSSMYTVKTPVTLESVAAVFGSLFTSDNQFTFSPVWQEHPYLSMDTTNGGYSATEAASLKSADYTAEKQDLTNTNSISIKPFVFFPHFKESGVTWRSTLDLVRTKFVGDADNPKWDYLTLDWNDSDSVTENAIDYVAAATEGSENEFGQSLTLTTKLPPQVDEYYETLKLTFPFVTYTIETGQKEKSATDSTWVKEQLKQALSVSVFKKNPLAFTASYNYELEENYNDSLKFALSWSGLQAAYTMMYTTGYDFKTGTGWVERGSKEFLPYTASLAYAPTTQTFYTWKNRVSIAPGLSTSIVADLLRPTNSYFIFSPSLTFKISSFLLFTFSSTSKNSVLYRYFQTALGQDGMIPGEQNIFKDLFNSFRFDNETLRKASGFKLQSLNFTLTHELHDWDFKTTFKLSPRLITSTSKKYYDFNPYVTIAITWRPMDSMKTEIRDKYGDWQLNP